MFLLRFVSKRLMPEAFTTSGHRLKLLCGLNGISMTLHQHGTTAIGRYRDATVQYRAGYKCVHVYDLALQGTCISRSINLTTRVSARGCSKVARTCIHVMYMQHMLWYCCKNSESHVYFTMDEAFHMWQYVHVLL